ncbi:AAA family ATPase [Candidatus Venteria ishoeyi]|uniref:ATP-dependent RecD-like DNA helicase n=1 Tax=Candidatus Venteria ishoeyi TaxID=1899563 RepID=A0A1H6FAQ6_9GAMM|nr:AAA family ATPase [Candidatus Venteria ishoeyi]SEH07190.1 ATP-dependent RecD-like DNA helicase [Candidatus Venteria ishoeyi]
MKNEIHRLTDVAGIAKKKLTMIEQAWTEHRAIRDVMIFLQGHGISTLFAVRIYKEYGDKSIATVTEDPYRLANDFYGIGFFSADKVALSIGLSETSQQRIIAAIKHVLAASREQGHCFLTEPQINAGIIELIEMNLGEQLPAYLELMQQDNQLRTRQLSKEETEYTCYYSKTLFYDEATVAKKLQEIKQDITTEPERIASWITRYCQSKSISLSEEQADGVKGVVQHPFAILTGGPGCGKTTTTLVIVRLLEAMKKKVLLAAPTGRATQRMSEVIGREAKTIHRLLEWKNGEFQRNEEMPLEADFLIVDECSMLDISLTASLLKAIPPDCQVLFIGDPDQLPSVGAGNVIKDIIASGVMPCYRLTKVFRQAQASLIIKYAHQINQGQTPYIDSPFKKPGIWQDGTDCLFLDSDEATKEQISFITRVKRHFDWKTAELETLASAEDSPFKFRIQEDITSPYEAEFIVPNKFKHVDLEKLHKTENQVNALKSVLKKVHPWSSLHYGLSAIDIVVKLYLEWIPKYHGQDTEIQILTPMTRGSLGTANLNKVIQQVANPPVNGKSQLKVGERIFREGDRVIHRRNNYDLNVFNGDIGKITQIDNEDLTAIVSFYPDNREVYYKKEDIMELDLAYAITIHKSQGSEFKAVIIPVLTQHFNMLYRNLIYTGLTRAKQLAVFVGTRKALSMAIRQQDTSRRQTALEELIREGAGSNKVGL